MPRSLLKYSLVIAMAILFACAGPPEKPAPPEKATGMEVAKGTTTTDLPETGEEPVVAPRPLTVDEYIERRLRDGVAVEPPVEEPPMEEPPVEEPPMEEPPVEEPPMEEPPVEEPPVEEPPMEEPPVEDVVDPRLRELAAKKAIENEYKDHLVKYYVDQAERSVAELEYEQAQEWVLRALAIAPDNQRALDLYHRILAALDKRGGTLENAKKELERLHKVKIEENQAKANYYFNQGKKAFHEERYDAAIDHFENVLAVIDNAPYGADWGTLKEETEQFLFQAHEKRMKAEQMAAAEAARVALKGVQDAELKRRREQQERLDALLTKGIEAFQNERFEIAESLAEQVMDIDPLNARARELRDQAVRARHRKTGEDTLALQKERFREWKLDIQKATVPWSSRPLVWPSQREWDRVNRRARAVTDFGAGTELDAQDAALKNKLREETVSFSFDGAMLTEALDFIRTLKGINIVVDEEIKGDLEAAPVTLNVTDLELDSALDLLLRIAGADYTYIFRQGVVYITNLEGARGEAVLRVHPVGDLTIRLTQFVAPNLILKPAGSEISEDAPLFGKAEEGELLLGSGADELVDLITGNIEPDSWEEGYTISVSGTDKLVVSHTPEVQAEVARFLDDLRKFAGLVVTIETRFLTVNDDFIQDVGVDILGLGGEKGTLVNLDDVTNGLEDMASAGFDNTGGTAAGPSAGNPSAGVFFNQGSDGDYRGRTENLFDRALGSVLSNVGGAIVQYTFLDDTSVSMILKAVEKSRHARLLQAPSLTVYNTQRANITLVNQLSFIQDFDVEVAQTAFIADPIVSIIQDGLALDVRPTISYDRKYVTLELQPTIATLVRPIPTFQTSLGALTTPVTLQLPETVIQKSQTTVRVPDGGSLVIGGLKNISFVDMQSETPFIAKIPIINFFFSRKGTSKEVENLMVIVTARITDLQEEETRFRSPIVSPFGN